MENHDWAEIKDSADCPYINNTLLPMASHAERYYTPLGISPSEPNYFWLEAGASFGIGDDKSPRVNHQKTTNHLVSQLTRAGISWKSYQENISGKDCPVTSKYPYAVWHNPFVYFDDVISDFSYCTNHIRPYKEIHADLKENRIARYNFITPNLTNIMHDAAPGSRSTRRQGDKWLAKEIPGILASDAYQAGGVIFIVWDEGTSDGPIGLIALSPFAKGQGYSNRKHYTHSSLLRTIEEIFGVEPFLRDAANAQDLSDLFRTVRFTELRVGDNRIRLGVTGIPLNKSMILETSIDLSNWLPVQTNSSPTGQMTFEEPGPAGTTAFFRIRELP